MLTNTQIGKKGEKEAINFLLVKGYTLLHTNYRVKRAEVDLIVLKENIVVFVEVKKRLTTICVRLVVKILL